MQNSNPPFTFLPKLYGSFLKLRATYNPLNLFIIIKIWWNFQSTVLNDNNDDAWWWTDYDWQWLQLLMIIIMVMIDNDADNNWENHNDDDAAED